MATIRLRNTKTREVERFDPIDPANVRMYVCGPTVYDRAHLGNARPVIVFDLLYRLLRHVYGADHVTYVRNFTDVDDKINAEALRRKGLGDPRPLEDLIRERTEETIGWYHADMDALCALRPSIRGQVSPIAEPRATDYIEQMKAMIDLLIEKGHAYTVRGPSNYPSNEDVYFDRGSHDEEHALFDVHSFSDYGKLSGRSLEDMIVSARGETAPFKRHPEDFVLWKPSDDDLPGWESPWGRGRPGWHIECSVMSEELLGQSFDIHGGGIDLQFPHHENEIAQSKCAHPQADFARVWMHNEMLQVEGKKMSKSLGNFFTVRDLLDQDVPGEVIRFVFLGTHYSRPMDWTAERAEQAKTTLRNWAYLCRGESPGEIDPDVVDWLSDDLNTSEALISLGELYRAGDARGLLASAALLGFDLIEIDTKDWARFQEFRADDGTFPQEGIDYQPTASVTGWGNIPEDVRKAAVTVLRKWLDYRHVRDFEKADALRQEALALGVELRATRSKKGVNGGTANLRDKVDAARLGALT